MSFVSSFDHTNSMTDSKLTKQQIAKLKENYALMIVDGMDMDSLITIAVETIEQNIERWDEEDLKEEILEYYGDETWTDLRENL